jgi:Ca-activated chloride channel family protein
MKLGNPQYALYLLLLVPMLGTAIYFVVARFKALREFGSIELVRKLSETLSRPKVVWKMVIWFVAMSCLFIALTAPQIGTRLREVKRKGIEIVFALDVSNSMLAEDVKPSRLSKAKYEISRFVERLGDDRVGLVVFAGDSFLQCPMTLDKAALKLFLDVVSTHSIEAQGTNFGAAIDEAMKAFRASERVAESPEKVQSRNQVIVLISDGEDHEKNFDDALKRALENKIRIYTVGVGSSQSTPIPIYDETGRRVDFKRDKNNAVITTTFDGTMLQLIAEKTGGKFFRIDASGADLDRLYLELQKLDKEELSSLEFVDFDHKFQIFVGIALALLMMELLISDRRKVNA